ncbi:MAG: enoyl-CoA hydratase/isomerase family protein, partial [Myxococcales bacterium]|nr:enoyl-CoA hydratase/isomerase family protein [Myxococcales bacterium]
MLPPVPPVTTTTADTLREVRLDRPKVNALDPATLHALADAFEAAAADDAVRGVLFLGTGRCYSAGLDLRHLVACDA